MVTAAEKAAAKKAEADKKAAEKAAADEKAKADAEAKANEGKLAKAPASIVIGRTLLKNSEKQLKYIAVKSFQSNGDALVVVNADGEYGISRNGQIPSTWINKDELEALMGLPKDGKLCFVMTSAKAISLGFSEKEIASMVKAGQITDKKYVPVPDARK